MQPSPLELSPAAGFDSLLSEPPADPPLSTGDPTALSTSGPAPAPAPAAGTPGPTAAAEATPGPAAVPTEPEVIWATARSTEQVLALVREARREFPDRPALVLRASAETLVAIAGEHDAYTAIDAAAGAAAVGPLPDPVGRIGVLCAGPTDLPIAAEAAFVARVTGTDAVRVDDLGGHRLRTLDPALLRDADCLVVVAGLEAALATTIAALTDVPVVAVPTSTGQPGAFAGLGALLTMLNSTSPGVVVSTPDNGYPAGLFASRLARRTTR